MELTTFTTAQIYSIFAALSCAAVAGFIFYCIGLRTGKAAGYELGRATAKDYWTKIVGHIRADLGEARDLLDIRTRDTASLREAMQHIERDLLQRLAAAAPLTEQDQAVLLAVADKLLLAGSTFAGIGAPDHARASSHLMAQVLDMTDRLKIAQANTKPHPDSELIEWLNDHAVHYIPDMSLVQIEMPTLLSAADAWPPHLRQMLRAGIEKQAAEAQEAAA
ncbi:hypothetical protein P2Q70_18630 [Pseudomonas mendocina]|uniref:hypothetical protein n=1 Tax=Ectopseudomonas mendocina TaxID=300 RepID=UPI0023DC8AB1|nr:hypothetical protein [Pseudomonas mendocina]MDF2076605.1 hypothetical protein [Pseudomonas mendocina]